MEVSAPDPVPLIPLLAERRTRRAFDPGAEITDQELTVLLEAARWAPSSFNTQPARFLVGRRDTEVHKRIFARIKPGNQRWAGRAAALLIGTYLTESAEGKPLRYAAYDLGQAVACLTVQASALGIQVCQMEGFDADGLHADLGLPEGLRVKVIVAVGRLGDPADLPEDLRNREAAPRRRHPLPSLLVPGGWSPE